MILDLILATMPSTNDHTASIASIPSSLTREANAWQLIFEDFMTKFGSILSVLETFVKDGINSFKNTPPHHIVA